MIDEAHLVQRRGEILTAAEKIFDARGYAATTMDAVAAEAGISKGSIYNYFHSKRDLFMQVFSAALAGGEAEFEQLAASPLSATEKLRRLLDNWSNRIEHYRRIGRLVLEFWVTAARQGQKGELAEWFGQKYGHWRKRIAEIVAEGVDSGEFGRHVDPATAASLILAVMDGITVQSILDIGVHVDAEFLAAAKRGVVAALRGPDKPEQLNSH